MTVLFCKKNSLKWLAMSVGLSTFTSPTLITLGADEFNNFEGSKLLIVFHNLSLLLDMVSNSLKKCSFFDNFFTFVSLLAYFL